MDLLAGWLGAIWVAVMGGAGDGEALDRFFGYTEHDLVYISAPATGQITEITTVIGTRVAAGELLFTLDEHHERLALDQARAELAVAEANLADLRSGKREAEVAVLEAELASARAKLELARKVLQRTQDLVGRGVLAQNAFDRDVAEVQTGEATVKRLRAELDVAHLPARTARLTAAGHATETAAIAVKSRRLALRERQIIAPLAGVIDNIFYDAGERIPANRALISIRPDNAAYFRFYVPEPMRAFVTPGALVIVGCDGCGGPITATVSRVSATAEFTPPLMYSLEQRAKLVFLVEARPNTPINLPAGQPVDVHLAGDP